MNRFNILYLHTHDAGRYIEPYGYAVPAPNLQTLAEGGVLFRQAFCAAPTCSPSRAALVTGQYPHCCGMFGLASSSWGYTLSDYSQHLAAFLHRLGYETALSGVQHVARPPWQPPAEIGYERLLNYGKFADSDNPVGFKPQTTVPAALDFLCEKHDRPFFLSVGLNSPHRSSSGVTFTPYILDEPEDIDGRYSRSMPPHPDTPETRREMANFKMGVAIMDAEMGQVLDALEAGGFADNTLVICTTDHGPGFPAMKCTLTDAGTGVFLILRGSGGFAGGKVLDGMVTHMDIYPTLCELLGVDRPEWLQGRSFLPMLRGEAEQVHETIFSEQNYHGRYLPLRAARTQRYKYIRYYGDDPRESVIRAEVGPTGALWTRYGWDKRRAAPEQLYDLIFDPHERNNLADRAGWEQPLTEMRRRLDDWMTATGDPLAKGGTIPEPPAWSHPKWKHRREEILAASRRTT